MILRVAGAAAYFCAAAALSVGCAAPRAAKPLPKPGRAYVRLQALMDAHPMTPSLRELDAAERRLNRTATIPGTIRIEDSVFSPVLAGNVGNLSDGRRTIAARAALRRNAEVTLARYITSLRNTSERIAEEKRAVLEGIARARSAEREAQARAEIENETRLAIAGRSTESSALRIKRNAARLNLSNNNIISVARDPGTNLPSEERLEEQIATLREREKTPPPATEEPFYTSDEARLTKLLRDLEAKLAQIRATNERDTLFNNAVIADAIATIRSDSAIWVEEQLALIPDRDPSRTELARIRRELLALLQNIQRTEQYTRVAVRQIANRDTPSLPPVSPVRSPVPATDALSGRLATERAAIQNAIRLDVLAAVRDAGLSRNVEPVFEYSSNLPDRTGDFKGWIFGNVDAIPLSYQTAPR